MNGKGKLKASEILGYTIESELRERRKMEKIKSKSTPKLGPRSKFIYYIYDLKMDLEEAVDKIIKEFPVLEKNNIIDWYNDEKNKRERRNIDEGR